MSEPWHGSQPPDTPVTVTLPYRTVKRVLSAVVSDAKRATSRGNDPVGVEVLAEASDVLGDAIDAPVHRRFRLPDRLYHAVIAGSRAEYERWLTAGRDVPDDAVCVDSTEAVLKACYSGHSTVGTWYRRPDAQELLAAVKARTFEPYQVRGAR